MGPSRLCNIAGHESTTPLWHLFTFQDMVGAIGLIIAQITSSQKLQINLWNLKKKNSQTRHNTFRIRPKSNNQGDYYTGRKNIIEKG